MRRYNPKITELFDSLNEDELKDLRWMVECGLTLESATQLFQEGTAEEATTGAGCIEGLPVVFTQSAKMDFLCVGERNQKALETFFSVLCNGTGRKGRALAGGRGWLFSEGPLRIVVKEQATGHKPIILAIAPAGIDPTTKVWRYFDQKKALSLLETGCLYFCRVDQLTGDPREACLPKAAKHDRNRAFEEDFGEAAPEIVADMEQMLRGETYVSCWTRREYESYLAWKHYCSEEGDRPGGGFAVETTWRRLTHLHYLLRSKDDQVFFRAVQYLDPQTDDLPTHAEGEQAFWKANWFTDETELRLAIIRRQSGSHEEILEHIRERSPKGEMVRCDLNLLVKKIVINPFASADQIQTLTETIRKCHPELASRCIPSAIT